MNAGNSQDLQSSFTAKGSMEGAASSDVGANAGVNASASAGVTEGAENSFEVKRVCQNLNIILIFCSAITAHH